MFFLNKCRPMNFMLIPSIWMDPSQMSESLNRAYKIEDFPAPVLPTIPTFIPLCTSKVKSFSTSGKPSLYLIETSLKLTIPL